MDHSIRLPKLLVNSDSLIVVTIRRRRSHPQPPSLSFNPESRRQQNLLPSKMAGLLRSPEHLVATRESQDGQQDDLGEYGEKEEAAQGGWKKAQEAESGK